MDLIVNFTPTGMIPTKDMTRHVPLSPAEIAADVHEALELGITMVHLHARDETTGEPSYRAETYGRIIEKIREFSTDLILCVSLSGRNFPELDKRSEPLQLTGALKPDMGSLTLSSVNFNRQASVSEPGTIQGLARIMQQRGILPELEAFDSTRTRLARKIDLVRRVHTLAEANERQVMKPRVLRKLLGLQPGDGTYGRAPGGEQRSS